MLYLSTRPGRGQVPRSANVRAAVILSAAKDLRLEQPEILRCAQDDSQGAGQPQGRSRTHLNTDTFRIMFAPLELASALNRYCSKGITTNHDNFTAIR